MKKARIAQIINDYWGERFPGPVSFDREISNHGSDNIVFIARDKQKYIFRAIFSDVDTIHNGSQIYHCLHQTGIPTPLPIKTTTGEYVIDASDDYENRVAGYSIHSFIEGSEEFADNQLELLIEEIALWVGKFHYAMNDLDYTSLDLRGRDQVLIASKEVDVGFTGSIAEQIPEHTLVQEMYVFWTKWKDSIDFSRLCSGLIHGDIGPGANMMMKDGKVTAFIDLIGVDFGYYMEDIGSFVMYGGLYLEESRELLHRFKESYLQYAPLNDKEFDLLPFFILRRFLLQALYFGWRTRIGYTQGNETDDGNDVGFSDALGFLGYWKKQYGYLMN